MVRRLARKKMAMERSIHSIFYHARGERSRVIVAAAAVVVVLGGVFRGFGGGNQSGKKLNITPEKRGRASFGNLGVSSVRWRSTTERNGLEGGSWLLVGVLGVLPRVSRTNNILTRARQTRDLCPPHPLFKTHLCPREREKYRFDTLASRAETTETRLRRRSIRSPSPSPLPPRLERTAVAAPSM